MLKSHLCKIQNSIPTRLTYTWLLVVVIWFYSKKKCKIWTLKDHYNGHWEYFIPDNRPLSLFKESNSQSHYGFERFI